MDMALSFAYSVRWCKRSYAHGPDEGGRDCEALASFLQRERKSERSTAAGPLRRRRSHHTRAFRPVSPSSATPGETDSSVQPFCCRWEQGGELFPELEGDGHRHEVD